MHVLFASTVNIHSNGDGILCFLFHPMPHYNISSKLFGKLQLKLISKQNSARSKNSVQQEKKKKNAPMNVTKTELAIRIRNMDKYSEKSVFVLQRDLAQ